MKLWSAIWHHRTERSHIVKANQILVSAMGHREARRVRHEFSKASVAMAGTTAYAKRNIKRLSWEGDRSPSRLGRAGERAEQVQAVLVPTATTIVAVIGATKAVLEAINLLKMWGQGTPDEPEPLGEHAESEPFKG